MPPQRTRYHSPGNTTRATSCFALRPSASSNARWPACWRSGGTSPATRAARRAQVSARVRLWRRLSSASAAACCAVSAAGSSSVVGADGRVRGGRFLQAREQRLQRAIVHRLQTRERQRRLIAHGEEDHRVAGGRRLQLVVQQALVDDADVFGREIGEIHWHVCADAAAALANAHGGAGEQAQDVVNVPVVAALALEARRLEHGERLRKAVGAGGVRAAAGREQFAAIGRDRQVREVRTLVYQAEQRQHAGPSRMALGERNAPRRLGGQPRPQPFDAVARVVQGVAARQQFAGFGEQRHHQPHRHSAGGAVDVRRVHVRAAFPQRLAVALNENLHRLAHPFAQHFGELRLALAGVADALQQRRRGVLRRRPQLGLQQSTQRRHLRRQLALREPGLRIPLAGGVEVHAGEQQAPVTAVGEQRQVFPASAQIGQRLANGATASANAEPCGIVQEYRQASASRALSTSGEASPFRR